MLKDKVQFNCEGKLLTTPFTDEYAAEIKAGTPVIRRVYLHEGHAHLLKIDAQGGDRNNEKFDLYTAETPATNGTWVEYKCDLCKMIYSFNAVISGVGQSGEDVKAEIPGIEKHYQCIHIHGDGANRHAFHLRLKKGGQVFFAKHVKLIN
jgi:hypothetical protein